MKSGILLLMAVTVAFAIVSGFSAQASAGDGCVETRLGAVVSELGEMKLEKVLAVDTGVLATFSKPGRKGVVMVGMTVEGVDLVTFQSVFGRDGASDLSAEESKWLGGLFDRLYPDAAFRACPELVRPQRPQAEAVFAAMQSWWKEQTQTDERLSGRTNLAMIMTAVLSVLVVLALSLIIVIRRRRRTGATTGSGSTVLTEAVTVERNTEPVGDVESSDDRQEVL